MVLFYKYKCNALYVQHLSKKMNTNSSLKDSYSILTRFTTGGAKYRYCYGIVSFTEVQKTEPWGNGKHDLNMF